MNKTYFNQIQSLFNRTAQCIWIFLFVVFTANDTAQAQDTTRINSTRLTIVTGVTSGTIIFAHIYQANAWWQVRAPFRFANDWSYALNVDKLGHVYATYFLSHMFKYSMMWSGVDNRTSMFLGSTVATLYELYVESEDGFHRDYGFSPGDAFGDIVGGMIPLVQETFPVLKNFSLKYSYFPSRRYLDELKTGEPRTFLDDYQGTTVWLGIDPQFLMNDDWKQIVPSWLGIAAGLSARNIDGSGNGDRIYSIALDYNFSKIKTDSDLLKAIFTMLDFIHWPAPGIRIDKGKFKVGVFFP